MTTPGNLDMEAFRKMMWAMMDEVVTKQTENLNAKLKEQTESLENKLEQQTGNFKQDTIKTNKMKELTEKLVIPTHILRPVSYTHLKLFIQMYIHLFVFEYKYKCVLPHTMKSFLSIFCSKIMISRMIYNYSQFVLYNSFIYISYLNITITNVHNIDVLLSNNF